DAPGEEGRRHLLQPQPGPAGGACQHVAEHRQREHEDADAAADHQRGLQLVERRPLQVAVTVQDQRAEVAHRWPAVIGARVSDWRRRRRAPVRTTIVDYLMSRTSLRMRTACGPSSAASWSWIGAAALMKPDLSTFSTTFTPKVLSLSPESFSSLSAIIGSV